VDVGVYVTLNVVGTAVVKVDCWPSTLAVDVITTELVVAEREREGEDDPDTEDDPEPEVEDCPAAVVRAASSPRRGAMYMRERKERERLRE
jgi:hypothetical protein